MCYLCGVKLLIFSDARMKIILFSRDQIDHRPQQMAQVFRAIERNGFTFAVNEEFARIVAHTLGRVIDPADIYRDTTGPQPRELRRTAILLMFTLSFVMARKNLLRLPSTPTPTPTPSRSMPRTAGSK